MADNKKSFILYADLTTVVKKLVLKDRADGTNFAGELFLHILLYVNDLNPIPIDFIVDMAFEPIKLQLKRDLIHWESVRNSRSESGKLGGRPKKQTKAKKPNALFEKQTKAKKAVTDTVTVTVNEIYREKDHLRITWDEMNKLIDEFGEVKSDDYINQVLNYRKNSKYKSLYLTALKWLRRDFAKPTNKKNTVLA